MRLFKYIFFYLLIFLFLNVNVYAIDCDSSDINKLKQLSKRVIYQYNYLGPVDDTSDYQTYEVYFNGLGNDFFVTIDEDDERIIFNNDDESKRIQSGNKYFKVYSSKCNTTVNSFIIDLPKFNYNSQSTFCSLHSDLDVCGDFYQITDKEFQTYVDSYDVDKENDFDIIDFLKSYYYIVIPVLFLLVVILVLFIINRIKKNRLD